MTMSGDTQVAWSTWFANLADRFPTLDSLDLAGDTVLIRSDLNVPLQDGEVVDDFRIRASLPTISEVHKVAGRVIVASHLGRPTGVDPALSMAPVAQRMDELAGFDVLLAPGVTGPAVSEAIASSPPGTVVVLENTRFESGESSNDPALADGLADLADAFVNDAFGTAHRAHASNVGVAERLPSAAGRLMEAELSAFQKLLGDPGQPFVVAMGGSKISDKLKVIENLLPHVDLMLIGGGMCFTLLKAVGYAVGSSLVENAMISTVERLLESEHGDKLVLPTDIVVADRFAGDAAYRTVPVGSIPGGWMGLDIGPETVTRFAGALKSAESVFWNGPMGVFEWAPFRAGTEGVATAIASSHGYTVIGGGDSVAAIRILGIESQISHVSSGGGAGLAMLEGAPLPGLEALTRRRDAT
jgi:phosphoglycerate kinase